MSKRVVIHRGPIPGTDVGPHWFEARDGIRYAICSDPYGVNAGWSYEVTNANGVTVDDSMFRFDEIREWAANQPLPPPAPPRETDRHE